MSTLSLSFTVRPTMRRLSALSLVGLVAAVGCTPAPSDETAASTTLADFRSVGWIEGSWRGSGGQYPSFFEEYTFLDDSTIRRRTYADSTFSVANDSADFLFRRGQVLQVSGSESRVMTRFSGDTVIYRPGPGGRYGYAWVRISDAEWQAILDPASPGGAPTVYVLRRVTR